MLCAFKLNFERLQNGMTEPGGDVVGGLYLLLGVPKRGNKARLSTTAFTLRKRTVPCRTEPSWSATLCRVGSARHGAVRHAFTP